MAKSNYQFQKRQKELARQKKKEEKMRRKHGLPAEPDADETGATGDIGNIGITVGTDTGKTEDTPSPAEEDHKE